MAHEYSAALGAFGNALIQALVPMGLGMALQPYPAATIITTDKEKGKQGDNGRGPVLPPQNGQQSSVKSSFRSRNRSSSRMSAFGCGKAKAT